MMRRRTRVGRARPDRHDRHGRIGRSPVVRPPLPPIETRAERFDFAVSTAVDFLRSAWPDLREVRFDVGWMPPQTDADGIPRWSIHPDERRIVLYRLPIERLSSMARADDLQRRMMVESCVFRAAAEYLDRDPWDLGPDRFRFG